MLFVVTLTYRRPAAEIDAQLDAHRDWLVTHARAGRIVFAGPLDTRAGGLIVVHCPSRTELDQMMGHDPFVIRDLVGVGVQGVTPALRHEAFSPRWAEGAKPVGAV